MTPTSPVRFFDLSTLLAIGMTTLLLISMPGGCGESEEDTDETDTEQAAEPTSPPMMEVVEAEPGIIGPDESTGDDAEDPQSEPEPDQETANDEPVEDTTDETADDGTYVVQDGDTLYEIAVRLNVSVDALLEANGISDPNTLQVGQVLEVPDQN